jgi:hypothetical protein
MLVAAFVAVFGATSAVSALVELSGTEAASRLRSGDTPDHVTIRLRHVGDSGVDGKATLRVDADITSVAIRLMASDGPYPAHIHQGTCDAFAAMPGFPLADAEPGRITRTLVEISLGDLLAGGYVIDIHRPATDLATLLDPANVVACGEIELQPAPATTGGTGGVTSPPVTGVGPTVAVDSGGGLAIGLVALACALAGAGMLLRRSERGSVSRSSV